MSDEERSLADNLGLQDPLNRSIMDSSSLSISDWLAGIRPTRRAVKLYPNAHLVARMEQIADEIDATPEDQNVDQLLDEFEQLREQFNAGVWFVVEKRSSEWEKKFRADTAARLGLKLDNDGDQVTVVLHQLAEQVISPPGVTAEQLRALADVNEGEANKLINAMVQVNSQLAEKAGVLARDFSSRRSAKQPG